jgi:hypothetical protein
MNPILAISENKERLRGGNYSYRRLFLGVTPCSLGKGGQCFAGIFCSYTKQIRDNVFLRNVRIHEKPRSPKSVHVEERIIKDLLHKKKTKQNR